MSTISLSGLSEAKFQQPLDNGIYTLEIGDDTKVSVKEATGNISLQIQSEVIAGPTQKDDSEPEGRKVYDFFQVTGLETHKDKGNFAMAKLGLFLTATGVSFDENKFDPEEIIDDLKGLTFIAVTKLKKDQYGELRENWSGHREDEKE